MVSSNVLSGSWINGTVLPVHGSMREYLTKEVMQMKKCISGVFSPPQDLSRKLRRSSGLIMPHSGGEGSDITSKMMIPLYRKLLGGHTPNDGV